MTPGEKRGNVAGYIDAACVLIDQVSFALVEAGKSSHPQIPPLIAVPPALTTQLIEARRILGQCAEWVLSEQNAGLENG